MKIEEKIINTMRKLALDEIANANSGHPGIALGIAPILYALYKNANVNSKDSKWFNRDRIVLSCGHGSSVLYSTLHLFGYDVSLDDLKDFRKLGSLTPGHPEVNVTDGVDASTGALGQGFATAVGMAMAEAHIRAKYNRKGNEICDHYTFVVCGDGDLMEGISYEASTLAGTFKLNKLIAIYDNNDVTMTDKLSITNTEDTKMRFMSAGWNVLVVENGEDFFSIEKAIKRAKKSKNKPTIIICKTILGYGSSLAGQSKCHGKPFSKQQVAEICERFGVSSVPFEVSKDVYDFMDKIKTEKQIEYNLWMGKLENYKKEFPKFYRELFSNDVKPLLKQVDKMKFSESLATREVSSLILNTLSQVSGNFFGGGADVAQSTMAYLSMEGNFSSTNYSASNIPFGVREHSMGAICNGIALHTGLKTFASTFLIFSDYMKYSIRQSALMNLPVLYILSHDSVWIGEDGPSHQPIEQTESLALVPNLMVLRPADATETAVCYKMALENQNPTALILSRQKLPLIEGSSDDVKFGGYIISKERKKPSVILIASGSEVSVCLEVQKELFLQSIDSRVVSMPCKELFGKQEKIYKNSVLPKGVKKVVVTLGVTQTWKAFAGDDGLVLGIDSFGESGNGCEIVELFDITVNNIVKNVKKIVK